LRGIAPAYDVPLSSLQQSASRVVSLVAASCPALAHGLRSSKIPPPQLYLAKWMRLVFAREVLVVEDLWDAFFELVSEKHEWMDILEAAAATRLLRRRHELLRQQQQQQSDILLNQLMNMPVEVSMEPWIESMQRILRGETLDLQPIHVPQQQQQQPPSHGPYFRPSTAATNGGNATSSEQHWNNTNLPLSFAPSVDAFAAGFSGLRDQLANQTKTITKRLYQELMIAAPPEQPRSYDDGIWNQSSSFVAASPSSASSSVNTTTAANSNAAVALHTISPQQCARDMESRIRVLYEFCRERQASGQAVVPSHVWKALGDLETMRQQLLQHSYE
jgi:hypothetical protein